MATGVAYRKLDAKGVHDFTGAGVYYGSVNTEANACIDKDIFIVGGGNSAGQAAVYMSNFARQVNILVRKPDLSSSMSSYLIDQISKIPNIEVIGETEVTEACGNEHLEQLVLQNCTSGEKRTVDAAALLIFIGTKPYTDWLPNSVLCDGKGYLVTGRELLNDRTFKQQWSENREPSLLETSVPGMFAAGDVRAGAMNRVASAVGEGSMSIKLVHEYLAQL